jgi:hypothetical protein
VKGRRHGVRPVGFARVGAGFADGAVEAPSDVAADGWLWQGSGGVWVGVRVLDAVTLEPVSGATVAVGAAAGVTGANGVATLGTHRGAQAVQVAAAGHVAWEGTLPFVPGFSPALYLVPTALTVTVENHQDMMETAYNIAVALTPILTELNGTAPATGSTPPTDADLRAAARRICQLQAVQQLSGVPDDIITQVQALPAEDATVESTEVRPAGLTGLWGMKKGADKIMDQEQRALAGEDVPEIDAYLSAHPYAGYRSLAQLRGDLGTEGVGAFFADYVFLARGSNGVDQMVTSGASVAMSGYPSASPGSMIGDYVKDTWGAVQGWVTTKVVDGVFIKGLQYLLGVGSGDNSGRTVIAVTKPDGTTKVAWPGGSWQVTGSGGRTYTTTRGSVAITSDGQTVAVTHPCATQIGPDGGQMVWVAPGEFMMGSPDGEGDAYEHPQHLVRITNPHHS